MERIKVDGRSENEQVSFPLGWLFISPWAEGALTEAGTDWCLLLQPHLDGNWGDLDELGRRRNKRALVNGEQVSSSFTLPTGKTVIVLTNVGEGETTIVTAEEYESE